MKRIGIVGGTFDPVHLGHIMMAISLKEAHHLDHLIFLPAGQNPQKIGRQTASKEHRLKMLKIALKGVPDVSIDTTDLDRDGPSYMIDTVAILKKKYPKAQFFLLIGEDLVPQLSSWKSADKLLEQVTVLTASREVKKKTPLFDVSATDIRKRLQAGKYVGHLLDKAVLRYIQKHGVYD